MERIKHALGSLTTLEVKKDGVGNYRETYLKFDLSSISSITDAKLRALGKLSMPSPTDSSLRLFHRRTNWTDATSPMRIAHHAGTLQRRQNVPGKTAQWIEWNLTTFLQAQKSAGKTLITLALKTATAEHLSLQFAECRDQSAAARRHASRAIDPGDCSLHQHDPDPRRLEQFVHSETRLRPSSIRRNNRKPATPI